MRVVAIDAASKLLVVIIMSPAFRIFENVYLVIEISSCIIEPKCRERPFMYRKAASDFEIAIKEF